VVPRLLHLIDNLTNWYIRFNRKRLKGAAGLGTADTLSALNTLFEVLFTLVRSLAPFMPFLTDHIYRLLVPYLPATFLSQFKDTRSVHFLEFPTVRAELFDENVERRVARMQKVIEHGRTARERSNIGLKTPLLTLVVLADEQILDDVKSLESYVREELNVQNIVLTTDEDKYNVRLQANVDWPTLGKKLKKDAQKIRKALPSLTNEDLRKFLQEKTITIEGIQLGETDLTVTRGVADVKDTAPGAAKWESSSDSEVIVLLDSTLHPELMDQGLVRELINRVQRLRKKAGLTPTDDVIMEYRVLKNAANVDLKKMIAENTESIHNAVRGEFTESVVLEGDAAITRDQKLIAEETQEVNNVTLLLRLLRL
jgi:isoleucyl-tRNA synthetase